MTYDRTTTERLLAGGTPEMLWDSEAIDQGAESSSSDYVDGWNDAVRAQAVPLADQLRAALAEIDRLTGERDEARADMEATEQRWAGTLDATFAVGDGTAQREIERLRAELERMRPVVDAAVELRRSDAGDHVVDGMSIAEATVAVEENAQKSLALLTRWRSAVDAYRSKP